MNRHAVPNAAVGFPGKPKDGGSNPRFYDFDDGVTRLVKWHPSSHGAKACYNELVASRLGQLTGAPILRGVVVYVPDEVIPRDHRDIGAKAGFHFGVAQMEGRTSFPPNTTRRSKTVRNSRTRLCISPGSRWAINKATTNTCSDWKSDGPKVTRTPRSSFVSSTWDKCSVTSNGKAETVTAVHQSYKLPDHLAAKLTKKALAPAIADLMQVEEQAIRECFQDCPDAWTIPLDDKEAGAARALAARERIEDILLIGNPSIK